MRLITPEEYIDDLYDGIDFPVDKNKLDLIGKLMTDYAKYYHRVQVKNCDLADVVLSEERTELDCFICNGSGGSKDHQGDPCDECNGSGKQAN